MRILIDLPEDRRAPGQLKLLDGDRLVFTCACLGKADNARAQKADNPMRDPLKPFGDTPIGRYSGSVVGPDEDTNGFGVHGRIALTPIAGAALLSVKAGRAGIMIHGGAPNSAGKLRPTYGCVRVSDDSMAQILAALDKAPLGVTVTES